MSVLKDHVFELALKYGVESRNVIVEGDAYRCPEPDWITGDFGNEFKSFLDWNGIKYQADSFVCREFALLALTVAKVVWSKTAGGTDDTLGIGLVGFVDLQHKLNVGLHRRPDESLYLAVYEPQNGMRRVPDREVDWKSCFAFQFL